jgi:Patatin-like phospholipase
MAGAGEEKMAGKADEEFQIALAMSGAISAGAYTSGVFDFLIQALDEWENARAGKYLEKGDDPGTIPNHFVGIKAMSGASAGALTAAIGAVALADADQKPIEFDTHRDGEQKIKCYLPKLYEAWVDKPGLVAEGDEKIDFLQTSDLDAAAEEAGDFSRTRGIPPDEGEPRPVTSLLNSRLLDAIARAALDVKHVADTPRPYISKTLHIYMTLSNLRGVPYSVPFDNDNKGLRDNCYHMISHGDRVHYAVTGLGAWDSENSKSAFADNDQKRELTAECLVTPDPDKPNWKDYAICALASAAFPAGLAPRLIGATLGKDSKPDEYEGRRLPIDALADHSAISPAWLPTVRAEDPFWFTTADGGIIDNDPFEYARFSLKDGDKLDQGIESALDKVNRAVIMVSPFPELKPIAPEGQPASDLASIVSALLPALIYQARFKPSEIVRAADAKHGSRYLIGPSRVTPDGKEQRYGIASGLLGGFGGFVARAFRDHDFQLGRRNCQRFLQDAFALPPENEIIKRWIDAAGARSHPVFKAIPSQDMPDAYPIIPLFGTAKAEVVLPAWPRIWQARFDSLQTRIAQRFDAVAPRLLAENVTGPLYFLLWLAVRPFPWGIGLIRSKVLDFVKNFMLADLVRRDMIEGWELPPDPGLDGDDIRLVLAELIDPAYDLRNAPGLGKAAGLDRTKVEAVLALGQSPAAAGRCFEIWRAFWTDKAGGPLYTLMSRKPAWHRWFLWRYLGWLFDLVLGRKRSDAWVAKPAVDKPGV